MKVLTGSDAVAAQRFIDSAAQVAAGSLCHRSACGSVIVARGRIIGAGQNSPPDGKRLPQCRKPDLPAGFKSDRTCCVHAEQNAIMDALRTHPAEVAGARLYFVRLDDTGAPKPSGRPYCTICSKMAEAAGLAEFVLWHTAGIAVYGAHDYNLLSFQHADPPPDFVPSPR